MRGKTNGKVKAVSLALALVIFASLLAGLLVWHKKTQTELANAQAAYDAALAQVQGIQSENRAMVKTNTALENDITALQNGITAEEENAAEIAISTETAQALAANLERFQVLDFGTYHFGGYIFDHSIRYNFLDDGSTTYEAAIIPIQEQTDAFNAIAVPVLNEARAMDTDLEKIKYIHDWMSGHMRYIYGYRDIYEAVVNGRGVCEGYAMTFKYFMLHLGIPCGYVSGYARGGRHAWNIVELDSEYYNVDVTWDNPSNWGLSQWRYDYFLISDAAISKDHRREVPELFPECTSAQYEGMFDHERDDMGYAASEAA